MIPLATTTVLVEPATQTETDSAPTYGTATGPHQAHLSAPDGQEQVGGADLERIDAVLLIDATVSLAQGDRVTDQGTGAVYRCAWVTHRQGLGLDHLRGGLVATTGAVPS